MPITNATRKRKAHRKPAPKTTNAPLPPPDGAEDTLWWTVFERRDFLLEKKRTWEEDDTTDLATKEERLTLLQKLLNDINDLIRRVDLEQLSILKRWHMHATDDQRTTWIEFIPLPPPENWQAEWHHTSTVTLGLEQWPDGQSEPERPKQHRHILSSIFDQAAAATDWTPGAAFLYLQKLARDKEPPFTGKIRESDNALEYGTDDGLKHLIRGAVRKYLQRHPQKPDASGR